MMDVMKGLFASDRPTGATVRRRTPAVRQSSPIGAISGMIEEARGDLSSSIRGLFGQQTPEEAQAQQLQEIKAAYTDAVLGVSDPNTPEGLREVAKKLGNNSDPSIQMVGVRLRQQADALQEKQIIAQRQARLTESQIVKNLTTAVPKEEKGIKLTATQSMYAKALKNPDGSSYYNKDNPLPVYINELDQFAAETIKTNIAADKNAEKIHKRQLEEEKAKNKEVGERAAKVNLAKNSIFKAKTALDKISQAEELVKETSKHIVGTTGFASFILKDIPSIKLLGFEGNPRKLEGIIDSIKARLGFKELAQMRKDSPTGGALGQVTERELMFLQSVIAKLDTSLNSEDFLQVLQEVKDSYNRLLQNEQENLRLLQSGYTQRQINEFTIKDLTELGVKGINPQALSTSAPSLKPPSEMTIEEIKQELGMSE
jgi:hypothetical protein